MAAITSLYQSTGPYVSAFVTLPASAEDARHQLDVRLRHLRDEVAESGLGTDWLDDLPIGSERHGDGSALAVIGAQDGRHVAALLDTEVPERTLVEPLPSLVPVLADEQGRVPLLVVLVDREGAEILGEGRAEVHRTVEGDTEHVQRVHGGGWSHRRFQQRAENTWEKNAKAVAEEVERLALLVGARLIYVAGDVRARGFLVEHLSEEARLLVEEDEREPQGDRDPFATIEDDVRRAAQTVAARDTVEVLERFREARGRDEAADGADEVLAALSEARVATLLVHDDLEDDSPRAWFDPGSPLAAAARQTLVDLGIDPVEGRLADIAVRSALLTDADVRVVPGAGPNAPKDGVAALLRWTHADEGPEG